MNFKSLFLAVTLTAASTLSLGDIPNADWQKLAAPGEGHKKLAEMAGKWTLNMKFWPAADVPAQESTGKSTAKLIMGGRYLQEDVTSKTQGHAFVGMGMTGYDNLKQEYQSYWIDNMVTSMMLVSGKMEGNVLKSSGTMSDPMSGEKEKWFRTETTFIDKNSHTYAMYTKDAKGAEFKSLEITYKRAK